MTNIVTKFYDDHAVVAFDAPITRDGAEAVSYNVRISATGHEEGTEIDCTASPCMVPISPQELTSYQAAIRTTFAKTTIKEFDSHNPAQDFVNCPGAKACNTFDSLREAEAFASDALASAIDAKDSE